MTADEGEPPPAERGKRTRRLARWRGGSAGLLLGLIVLSTALIVASLQIESGLESRNEPPPPPTDQITVTGSAQQAVTSDSFQWHASLASSQATTSGTLGQLTGWTSTVHSLLGEVGATPGETTISSIAVHPNSQNGVVSSYSMSDAITVHSSRLELAKGVASISDRVLAQNIPLIAQDPEYYYSHLKRLRPVLVKEATADARRRALAALGHHGTLGKSISIEVGQISVDAPGSVDIGSGDYDTSTVPKVVSVVVTASYKTS